MMFSPGKPKPLIKLMTSVFTQELSAFLIFGRYNYVIFTGCDLSCGAVSRRHFSGYRYAEDNRYACNGHSHRHLRFDLLDPKILGISSELRQIALIIILIKAGLSLNLSDLKKVGRPAVMMSFLPASFEILGYFILAPLLLGINHTEAAVMGAVLGAVSPAVVVPRMVKLMEEKYGTEKAYRK